MYILTAHIFFFFKQKTAYEMLRSLVGSEMCIRDRTTGVSNPILHEIKDKLKTQMNLEVELQPP